MVEVVGQVLAISPEAIDAGGRLRPVDPVWAGVLATMIDRDGQHEPAEVCRMPGTPSGSYRLVVGGHRHAACLSLGRPLQATVGGAGELRRRSREVSEHLFRRDLDPVSRAAFVADLIAIEQTRAGLEPGQDGRAASAAARWGKAVRLEADSASDTVSLAYGWAAEVAGRVGLDRRTIYRDLQLHRGLLPDVAHALRGLAAAQLRALAKLDPDAQRRAARLIGEGRKPAEALALLAGRTPLTAEDKAWSAAIAGFEKLSKSKRRELLRVLDERGLLGGATVSFGGAS